MDQALLWLSESIGHPYPLVGLHVESDHSSIRMLQLATATRAVLIRIPDKETLREQAKAAARNAAASSAAAAAAAAAQDSTSSSCSTGAPSSASDSTGHATQLFTPLFYQFMANRQIFKSGLEACTDALQLYTLLDFAGAPDPSGAVSEQGVPLGTGIHPTHPRCEINSGLNINWNMMNRSKSGGVGLGLGSGGVGGAGSRAEVQASLEAMCDSIIGAHNSFHVDAAQTYTDWGCEFLTLRQVVYAALNAQVAYVIACTQSLPTPFHLSDLPRNWILQAASWRNLQSRQAELATACSMGLMSTEDEAESGAGSSIGTPEARQEVAQLASCTEFYFARYTQGEEPFNPYIATLLQLRTRHPHGPNGDSRVSIFPDPAHTASALASINPLTLEASSGLSIETSNAYWWFEPEVAQNTAPVVPIAELEAQLQLDGSFNAQQRAALDAMDRARISILDGGAGTGKSQLLAAAVLRSLARSSSINTSRSSPAVHMSSQRVLCVTESAHSAAHLASLLARALPPSRLVLFASPDVASGWSDDGVESQLLASDYVQLVGSHEQQQQQQAADSFGGDRDVLVCSLSFALLNLSSHTQRLLKHRQTVLLEDAHNMWLLKAVLLLRKLPHVERLVLVGDSAQLAPIVGKQEGESVLATALVAAQASASSSPSSSTDVPSCFQPLRCSLSVQYRFAPHLSLLLSSLFYRGALQSDPRMLSPLGCLAFKKRALGWVDVPGAKQGALVSAGGSWSNRGEIAAIGRLWEHYVDGLIYAPTEVAILPLYESQRRELQRLQPQLAGRVFTVEQVQGREFALVILSLAAPGVTHHLSDPRRALVALSRARFKAFIVADRESIAPFHSIWMLLEEYEQSDVAEEITRAEAEAKDAAAFLPASATGTMALLAEPTSPPIVPAQAAEASATAVPVAAAAAAPRRSHSGTKSGATAAPSFADASSKNTSPEPAASAATVTNPPVVTAAAVLSGVVSPSNPWSKVEPSKLMDASIASASSSSAAAAPAAPASLLAGLPPEDIPRIAHLSSIFALHSPLGQPLLIDNIGKLFKARFGTSWRAYERMEREAKLIAFLTRFPHVFRLSQNLEESIHVRVEWVAEAEFTKQLLAAAAAAAASATPNGTASSKVAVPAPLASPIPVPAAAPASGTPITAASASASAAAGSSVAAPLDPYAFESVLVTDPSLPQLDGELIDALFQAILSAPEPVLLSDLSKLFKQYHQRNWNTWTELKLGEFLRKYSPAYFKFKNNHQNTRNPIVEVVIAPTPVEDINGTTGTAASANGGKEKTPPPVTVVASNVVEKPPMMSSIVAAVAAPSAAAAVVAGNTAASKVTRGGATSAASIVAAASAASPAAPTSTVAVAPSTTVASSSSSSTRPQDRLNTQDVFSAAASLASSVPASQIDDLFRLECLRLVFLDAGNRGLRLVDIGNLFHALHGLRWKRLTKTELRLSDFMYEFEGVHFDFVFDGPAAVDAEGRDNPLVYFRDVEKVLFVVGSGGRNKAASQAPKQRARDQAKGGGSIEKSALVPESLLRHHSSSSSGAARSKHAALGADDFLTVTSGRHAAKHPSALAHSIASGSIPNVGSKVVVPAPPQQQQRQVLCSFCQTVIPPGDKLCPNCDTVVGEVFVPVTTEKFTPTPPAPAAVTTATTAASKAPSTSSAASSSSAPASASSSTGGATKKSDQPAAALSKKEEKKAAAQQQQQAAAEAKRKAQAEADKQRAAAAAEAEAAAAKAAADAAAAAAAAAAGPTSEELYVGFAPSDFLPDADREKLSKKVRRKLLWLCWHCKASNPQSDNKCQLCETLKPPPGVIRYKNPVTAIRLPPSAKGGAPGGGIGVSSSTAGAAAPAGSSASSSALSASSASASLASNKSPTPAYENEWVRINHSADVGYHYVSKVLIPAGTHFLTDDILWSSSAGALESSMGSCIPNESQFSELMTKLLRDPIMVQHLSNKHVSQYAMIGKMLNLRRPKDVGMKEWSAGVEMTLTGAQFQREQAPGHSKSCNCAYGRFWMKRQSALLVHSCWPNCAHVKRPSHAKESHSLLATCDIAPGTVLTDCMNSALLSLPRDRRWQWMAQTMGKSSCTCDRCKNPRKQDALLTAATPQGSAKINANKLEEDYESIIKQYTKLNQMARTSLDDPSFSSPSLDEKYFESCYLFLSAIHTFLTSYHGLSALHWRKQYLRNLFVTLVAKNELYDLDLFHPDPRRMGGASSGSTAASTTSAASAAASAAGGSPSFSTPLSIPVPAPASPRSLSRGKYTSPLLPFTKVLEERRTRHHFYLQMILTQVLAHLESNAQFYPSHEPLKCSAIFLLYSLIDWFDREEHEHCVMEHAASPTAGGAPRYTTCFTFTFDRCSRDISAYLAEKLAQMEPHADALLKLGFPLRA